MPQKDKDFAEELSAVESEVLSEKTGLEIPELNSAIQDSKPLRQGPWMHPFPIITGISILALLVSVFFANVLINRYSD